jgi:hypothetical protein
VISRNLTQVVRRQTGYDVLVRPLVEVQRSAIQRSVIVGTNLNQHRVAATQHILDDLRGADYLVRLVWVEAELSVARSDVENRDLSRLLMLLLGQCTLLQLSWRSILRSPLGGSLPRLMYQFLHPRR